MSPTQCYKILVCLVFDFEFDILVVAIVNNYVISLIVPIVGAVTAAVLPLCS